MSALMDRPAAPAAEVVTPPTRPPDTTPAAPEVRRVLRAVQGRDVYPVIGALAGGFSLAYVLYYQVLPWSGLLGFLVLGYALFIALYGFLVAVDGNGPLVKDRLVAVVAHSFALVMLTALVLVVGFVFWRGREALGYLNFFTEDLSVTGPLDPLDQGGIVHGILGTLIMISLGLAITIPLGLGCAVFLAETRGPFTRFVRTIVEAMTALPSIIAGLFVYAAIITLIDIAGDRVPGSSGVAAAVAISVMMLPIIIRAADVVLRLVPGTLKEGAAALGAPRWRIVWHVILPTARSGLMTAIILGTARGIGETSPVLLTAGFTGAVNVNPLSGPMVSLPLVTFTLTRNPEPGFIARGFGAAAVLMILVLALFVLARTLGGRPAGDLSRAQARRRARQSRADLARFEARASARAQAAALTTGAVP